MASSETSNSVFGGRGRLAGGCGAARGCGAGHGDRRGLQVVGLFQILRQLKHLEDLHVDQGIAQGLDVIGERGGFRG